MFGAAFDNEMYVGGEKSHLSRCQNQAIRQKYMKQKSKHPLEISAEKLQELQEEDPTQNCSEPKDCPCRLRRVSMLRLLLLRLVLVLCSLLQRATTKYVPCAASQLLKEQRKRSSVTKIHAVTSGCTDTVLEYPRYTTSF